MARIEWAALGGDEVETVVSMLIFNEHPRATRIRPSRGDFGIDVLVPHPGDPSSADVWQIKKFAANLSASQQRQIEESFQRVLVGLVRRGIPLADWSVVMPLDPTIENALDWFATMPDRVLARMSADTELALTEEEESVIRTWRDAPGRTIGWKGLTYCEALAARYWFVPDYYLHGGNERVRNAVAEVAKILQRDLTLPAGDHSTSFASILSPVELTEHLARLGRALDGDPHFRYGVSVDPVAPQLPPEPGLIAAAQQIASDGMCITIRIYARFAEALNERPIPIKMRFQFEPGSVEQRAHDDWLKYGKPLTAVVSVDSDLPGGLGGSYDNATAVISPADGRKGETRYRILTPSGEVVAELRFFATSTTGLDGTGIHVQGQDSSGVVTIEAHLDATDQSGRIEFSFGDLTNREAVEVAAAAEFAASFAQPNRLQVAGKHGPYREFQAIIGAEPPLPPAVARYVRALSALQPYTATAVVVPDLGTVTEQLAHRVHTAAKLLDGQTIIRVWEAFDFETDCNAALDPNGHYQLATIDALTVLVGEQTHTLGAIENTLLSVNITDLGNGRLRAEPQLNNTGQQRFAPNESIPPGGRAPVRFRPAPEN